MTDKSFFVDMVKSLDDVNTNIADSGNAAAEYTGSIDTGSYILNALLTGSIWGGVPNNKITAFAGEEATGKTFYLLACVKSFLDANPEGAVFYFDTEAAITNDMMKDRGIDTSRVIISEPESIQEFRHKALKIIENYTKVKEKERPPMMMCLDSLGQLSTTKELEDTAEGKETRDMTRAQVIKAAFRVLTLKLARAKIPLLLTNHVYANVGGYGDPRVMSGGSGLKYAASQVIFLGKRKHKEDKDVIGNVITATMVKSRFTKEQSKGETRLTFDKGLERYFGLLDIAEKYGIFEKLGNKYIVKDGTKQFEKTIYKNPEKFFTQEVLEELDKACQQEFCYGSGHPENEEEDENDEYQHPVQDSVE